RANDLLLVEIVKPGAAGLTGPLETPIWFRHRTTPKPVKNRDGKCHVPSPLSTYAGKDPQPIAARGLCGRRRAARQGLPDRLPKDLIRVNAPTPPRISTARPGSRLAGEIAVPGDKSISHRALMFGGLAVGETVIHGLLEGEDVIRTATAMQALGATAVKGTNGKWSVRGRGVGGLVEPADVLDLGNSGTSARLLMGILATTPFTTFMTGDASLRRRPMGRVATPLSLFG